MRWEVSDSVDIFAVLKKLEEVWNVDLAIMLFSDGSGHIMNPYNVEGEWHSYFEWDTDGEFTVLMKKLNENPEANRPSTLPTTELGPT